MAIEKSEFVSMSEVGERLDKSERSAYRAVKRGEIPSFRVGRRWFVPRQSFESLMSGDRDAIDAQIIAAAHLRLVARRAVVGVKDLANRNQD